MTKRASAKRTEHARYLRRVQDFGRVGGHRFLLESPEGRIRVRLMKKGSVLLWAKKTSLRWRKLAPAALYSALVLLVEEPTRVFRQPVPPARYPLTRPASDDRHGTATRVRPAPPIPSATLTMPVDLGYYHNPILKYDPEARRADCKARRHARRTWRKLRHEARRA